MMELIKQNIIIVIESKEKRIKGHKNMDRKGV